MPMSQVKFRKRVSQKPAYQTAIAARLREVGAAISRHQHAEALQRIDHELKNSARDAVASGRLLALAADSEFRNARFEDAQHLYQRAEGLLAEHPRHWMRPRLGSIRCLIKSGRIDDAAALGMEMIEAAILREKAFGTSLARSHESLLSGKNVVVPAAPLRASTLASRVGHLFLLHGDIDHARGFFQRSMDLNKRGVVLARIGLARIALVEGDADLAFRYAREAILAGKSSAKTASCWPVLIAARRKLGGWMIGEDLIACVRQAPKSVRARVTVIIAAEMRKHDMRQWQALALEWLQADGARYPAAAAEIKKMILASWKTIPGHAEEKGNAGKRLIQTANLSRNEWLSGIKQVVLSDLTRKQEVDLGEIAGQAAAAFDLAFGFQVRHSLALTCMQAGHHDKARSLLQSNIEDPACPVRICSRSSWASGRMERALGDHDAAAEAFAAFAGNVKFEMKFRLQARLLWVESMVAAGQSGAILAAREELSAALSDIKDFELLMNVARQIRALSPELSDLAFSIFDRAAGYAITAFHAAAQPSAALEILFKLTRRMVCDFDRHRAAVDLWEKTPVERRDWLWQAGERYWEYLGLLVTAYGRSGQESVAVAMARGWIEDPVVPLHGRVHIITSWARLLLDMGRIHEALSLFTDLVVEAPSHPLSAIAWYWLALEAHQAGDTDYRNSSAAAIRRAQGPAPGLLEEWKLDARALILLNNLEPLVPRHDRIHYDDAFMMREAGQITRDLARIL